MNSEYGYWFACLRPLSDRKKCRLMSEFKEEKELFHIEEKSLNRLDYLTADDVRAIVNSRKSWDGSGYEKFLHSGMQMITRFQEAYPGRLQKIPSPPYALYVKGKLPLEEAPCAAIVGARRCTPYGEEMALEFGEKLAACGVQIISGMAKGIDGAGQRGALNAGGVTYGVLGCGADVCYPREHIGLYMDIQREGGILSEQPPQSPPLPAYFPARNRIISGLADVVLVMEAKEKSGSLITADMALEQGRDVYALPGPLTSSLSRGCNSLIRQGAGILLSPEELLLDMGIPVSCVGQKSDKNEKVLESTDNLVYSCLGLSPKSVDQLAKETSLAVREVLERLISLELKGYSREISKNYYIKVR